MSEANPPSDAEPTLVEKWIKDQQEWQRIATEYFDSMVKNDDFLVHLGNAMRGSLLAGKPYPGTEPPEENEDETSSADERIDLVLHALHLLQGDVSDLKVAVEDLAAKISTINVSATSATSVDGATAANAADRPEIQILSSAADSNRYED